MMDGQGELFSIALDELQEVTRKRALRDVESAAVSLQDRLELAEAMSVARERISSNKAYGEWLAGVGVEFSRPWMAKLVKIGRRWRAEGRPVVNPVYNGRPFSLKRYANGKDPYGTSPAVDEMDLEAMMLDPETETVRAGDVEPGDVVIDDRGEAHPVAEVTAPDEHGEVALIDRDGDALVCSADVELQRLKQPTSNQRLGHPCPFSSELLPIFAELLHGCANVLDPFAGTGRIHQLRDYISIDTAGIELEPEWAGLHPDTDVGDATDLPFADGSFAAICTSPAYGNRMADRHNAKDDSHRNTYKHMLGRDLSANNAGGMRWGDAYRDLHQRAWKEALRVLAPQGRLVLNVKDHIRNNQRVPVSAWHLRTLNELGFTTLDVAHVATSGIREGENADQRVHGEFVFLLEVGQ